MAGKKICKTRGVKMLRLLSFNIHGGRSLEGERDLTHVHALMQDHNIDIGVFQEMETRKSRGKSTDDVVQLAGPERPFHFIGASITDSHGWYGNLIVSRYPMTRCHVHNLETNRFLEPRNAIDALVETPLGKIRVIGTHLSLVARERWTEGKNLLRLMDDIEARPVNPVFLMGDINEWRPTSNLIRHLNKLMKKVPCGATFPSFRPILRLDRVWHDSQFKVSVRVLRDRSIRRLSDHLPLVIEAGL